MSFYTLWKKITKSEWKLLLLITAAVIVLTTAPVVYGFLAAKDGQTFTAQHFVSAEDWFVYYSFINQAKEGKLLLHDLFAPVEHMPVVRPLWTAVGWIAAELQVSAPIAFHLARILLIPPFFILSYLLLCAVFDEKKWRKLALLFLAFSSGLGVFLIHRLARFPVNYVEGSFRWPMDLWVPDINTFLTLHTSPHFIAASILLMFVFLSALVFVYSYRLRYALYAGAAGSVLFLIHPFQVVKVFAVLGIFWFCLVALKKFDWRQVWFIVVFSLLVMPVLLYYAMLLQVDQVTIDRTLQNLNPSAPPHLLLVTFGGLLPLALVGVWKLWKTKQLNEPINVFLIVWMVVQLLLLYAPLTYQRRLGLGAHIPLVLLSSIGMQYLLQRYYAVWKRWYPQIVMFGILVFLPSTCFAVAVDFMVYGQQRELSYLSSDETQAVRWLHENASAGSIIFGDVKTGNMLPAFAVRTTYVGHAVETPAYIVKKYEPTWFFSENRLQDTEHKFLQERHITHLYYGEREKELGPWRPAGKTYLTPVFTSSSVIIYQVQ